MPRNAPAAAPWASNASKKTAYSGEADITSNATTTRVQTGPVSDASAPGRPISPLRRQRRRTRRSPRARSTRVRPPRRRTSPRDWGGSASSLHRNRIAEDEQKQGCRPPSSAVHGFSARVRTENGPPTGKIRFRSPDVIQFPVSRPPVRPNSSWDQDRPRALTRRPTRAQRPRRSALLTRRQSSHDRLAASTDVPA